MIPTNLPEPEEWHPAYEGQRRWLTDWVNGEGPYASRSCLVVPLPAMTGVQPVLDPVRTEYIEFKHWALARWEARGLVPYTGEHRFVYSWFVALDELGRAICGSTWPKYDPMWPCKDRNCGCRAAQ